MDPVRFDSLVKLLSTAGTRRRLVRLLAALPLGMALGSLVDDRPGATAEDDDHGSSHRRRRRKTRNARQSGNNKDNRKGKRKGKESRAGCTPESRARTCAGRCGPVINTCGTVIECDPCTCATGCHPVCQTCNPTTGLCDPAADSAACDDGNACTQTSACQGGVCVGGSPVVCTAPNECQIAGACDPVTGCPAPTHKGDGTPCADGFCCGGECKECCTDQHCPSGFCHGHKVCAPKECTQTQCAVAGGEICGRHVPTGLPCFCYTRTDNGGFFCASSRPVPCSGEGTCVDPAQVCTASSGPQCELDPFCAVPCEWPT
jgi:hypothetical protein